MRKISTKAALSTAISILLILTLGVAPVAAAPAGNPCDTPADFWQALICAIAKVVGVDPGSVQFDSGAVTPEPQPAATLTAGDCTLPDFSSYVGNPYGLIAVLDAQSGKGSFGPSTITATECMLIWTGAYTGPNLPTGLEPLLVDGRTGVFYLAKDTVVTVSFAGGMLSMAQFDPTAKFVPNDGNATGCMPATEVISLLNTYGQADPERLFRELDLLNNADGARYVPSRMRPTPDGPATYTVENTKAVWWVRTGSIEGEVIPLVTSLGKTLYLATTDGEVSLTHAHTGAVLCEDLNPERDIDWWGR